MPSRPMRTPRALGAAVRERRQQRGMTQAALAARAGVGREWLVAFEAGHSRAQLGRVMDVVAALDLQLVFTPAPGHDGAGTLDRHLGDLERTDP